MDGVRARELGGGDDGGDVQVAARGLRRSDADRLVRQQTVQGVSVGGRIDGDAPYPDLPARADDAEGHLPAVRDEDLGDHGSLRSGRFAARESEKLRLWNAGILSGFSVSRLLAALSE